jgi:hypothetical protein
VVGGLDWWPTGVTVEGEAVEFNDWGVGSLGSAGKDGVTDEEDAMLFDPEGDARLGECRKLIPV